MWSGFFFFYLKMFWNHSCVCFTCNFNMWCSWFSLQGYDGLLKSNSDDLKSNPSKLKKKKFHNGNLTFPMTDKLSNGNRSTECATVHWLSLYMFTHMERFHSMVIGTSLFFFFLAPLSFSPSSSSGSCREVTAAVGFWRSPAMPSPPFPDLGFGVWEAGAEVWLS